LLSRYITGLLREPLRVTSIVTQPEEFLKHCSSLFLDLQIQYPTSQLRRTRILSGDSGKSAPIAGRRLGLALVHGCENPVGTRIVAQLRCICLMQLIVIRIDIPDIALYEPNDIRY
jgi:hypothetical protein